MQFVCMDDAGNTEDWRRSDVTRMVAVLAALGVPVAIEKVWRDKEGDERVTFSHGPRSVHQERAGLPVAKELARLYKSGELRQNDPHHPMLDGLRAIANLLAIQHWLDAGDSHAVRACVDHRCLLVPGLPPRNVVDVIGTKSIHRAAALCLFGFDLIGINEPEKGKHAFIFDTARRWPDVVDARQLISDHQTGLMPQVHPFAFAVESTRTFLKLCTMIEDQIFVLMFKARGEPRYGFVREDATTKAKAKTDHFIATGESS